MRGISFLIPNQYGRYLFDILEGIDINKYFWKTGGEEAYYIEENMLGEPLFPKPHIYSGTELYSRISEKEYYVIFADLKAFINKKDVEEVATYEDFVLSPCEFALLIVDCSYVTIYAKDQQSIARIYAKAVAAGFENIEYITDGNDTRTTLSAF